MSSQSRNTPAMTFHSELYPTPMMRASSHLSTGRPSHKPYMPDDGSGLKQATALLSSLPVLQEARAGSSPRLMDRMAERVRLRWRGHLRPRHPKHLATQVRSCSANCRHTRTGSQRRIGCSVTTDQPSDVGVMSPPRPRGGMWIEMPIREGYPVGVSNAGWTGGVSYSSCATMGAVPQGTARLPLMQAHPRLLWVHEGPRVWRQTMTMPMTSSSTSGARTKPQRHPLAQLPGDDGWLRQPLGRR
jgi:hypothetical protein